MTQCVHELEETTCAICLGQDEPVVRRSVEQLAALLFDYAVTHSKWTKEDAGRDLGAPNHALQKAIREMRRVLSDDNINLVVYPEGGHWYYQLVGDLDAALPWATVRLRNVESQLATLRDVTSSIVNSYKAKPNSRDARRAKMIAGQLNILGLQLASIED